MLSLGRIVTSKSYAASRASNTELLILVLDFKLNSSLKNSQRNFQWNLWNAFNEDAYKKITLCHTTGIVTQFSPLPPNCLILSPKFMDPVLIL